MTAAGIMQRNGMSREQQRLRRQRPLNRPPIDWKPPARTAVVVAFVALWWVTR